MDQPLEPMTFTSYSDDRFQSIVGKPYAVMLNPASIFFGRNVQQPDTLSFSLVIDCTGIVDASRTIMNIEMDALKSVLFNVNGNIHQPNHVLVEWGKDVSFKGRISTFNVSYTLFRPDGSPLRAKIDMAFQSQASPVISMQELQQLYTSFNEISIKGITAPELQHILFAKMNKVVATGNWDSLAPEHIWNEMAWEVHQQKNIPVASFIHDIEKWKDKLPAVYQDSLPNSKQLHGNKDEMVPTEGAVKESITINNAGLVLISVYFPILFQRLGVLGNDDKTIIHPNEAVHHLHYLVTGTVLAKDDQLVLNKLLCGLPPDFTAHTEANTTEDQKKLMDGLLEAVIGYWPAIGASSIQGFRGNWLVRNGQLIELHDKWELTVEKRAYDILIHQSPFSFSIIKFPWMEKPLYVHWPY